MPPRLEGRPLLEVEPKAPKMLGGGTDFWIKLDENTFLKGFSERLVGMQTGETRDFDLTSSGRLRCRRVGEACLGFQGHAQRDQEHAASGTHGRVRRSGRPRINPRDN